MYNSTDWKDHITEHPHRRKITENGDGTSEVVKDQGEVLQQGTPQSATNFNNMENGIQDATLAASILLFGNLHQQRGNDAHAAMVDGEILGETQTVTLKNTAKFPFNSTRDNPVTVALKQTRRNLFYTVEAEQTGATGEVGSIEISAKALNGFKVAFTGSAKSVTLQIRVKGGMT